MDEFLRPASGAVVRRVDSSLRDTRLGFVRQGTDGSAAIAIIARLSLRSAASLQGVAERAGPLERPRSIRLVTHNRAHFLPTTREA